jgi:GNAT superfamily N-acetyltransferase
MEIQSKKVDVQGIKFFILQNDKEIARTFLYILKNDLHKEPFGFFEDVFVEESYRGQGLGTKIVEEVIKTAKENGCYKLICTSRHENDRVHDLYSKLGFKNHGLEFRMDF